MKDDNLYNPSLEQEGIQATKSYQIDRLFYVAFFGGTVALAGLALTNAKMLRMEKRVIQYMLLGAILIFAVKMGLYYSFFNGLFEIKQNYIRYIGRAFDIALFGAYYFTMKRSYQTHLLLHGGTIKMLKPAIGWILIAMVVEGIFIIAMQF
jgi:hypothetical protein